MKWYWWLLIGIVVLSILIYIFRVKILQLPEIIKEKKRYQQYLDNLKSLKEGDSCTNYIPSGSQMANFMGLIKDGKCQPLMN